VTAQHWTKKNILREKKDAHRSAACVYGRVKSHVSLVKADDVAYLSGRKDAPKKGRHSEERGGAQAGGRRPGKWGSGGEKSAKGERKGRSVGKAVGSLGGGQLQ